MAAYKATAQRVEDRFLSAFERHEALRRNGSVAQPPALRRKAMEAFLSLGFPARKAEQWKYTNLSPILRRPYTIPFATESDAEVTPEGIPGLDAHVVVLLNGRFSEQLSRLGDLPSGVVVSSLARGAKTHAEVVRRHLAAYARFADQPFVALNTAFLADGAFIYAPPNTALAKPMHIIQVITAAKETFVQPRTLVVAGERAQLRLVETMELDVAAPSLINSVCEVYVGARAKVERFVLQAPGPRVSMITSLSAYQETESQFHNGCFTFSGEVVRNNISITPDAEQCETLLHGLFVARGVTHVDNHTLVDHAKPNCFSSEFYKGILDDRATGVFNGKVLVRQDAQQTNAYQTNKNILLTDTAHMYAKPELEIYADDVKCSHGATTGQLDEDAIFYLRSRGLTPRQARALMLVSFARDIVDKVPLAAMRAVLDDQVAQCLGA